MNRRTRVVLTVSAALLLAVLLIGASPARTADAAGASYHVVRYGETLSSISRWYGVNVWSLACANGLANANYIYAGQVLYIPVGGQWYKGHGCVPYQGGYQQVKYVQPPCYYGCQPVVKPAPCTYNCKPPVVHTCTYRVRHGDTLSGIAWRYHTTVWSLAQYNRIPNPNYIYAGQMLRLPGCKYL